MFFLEPFQSIASCNSRLFKLKCYFADRKRSAAGQLQGQVLENAAQDIVEEEDGRTDPENAYDDIEIEELV